MRLIFDWIKKPTEILANVANQDILSIPVDVYY